MHRLHPAAMRAPTKVKMLRKTKELTVISHVEVGGLCPGAVPSQRRRSDPHAVVSRLQPAQFAALLAGKVLSGHAEVRFLREEGRAPRVTALQLCNRTLDFSLASSMSKRTQIGFSHAQGFSEAAVCPGFVFYSAVVQITQRVPPAAPHLSPETQAELAARRPHGCLHPAAFCLLNTSLISLSNSDAHSQLLSFCAMKF